MMKFDELQELFGYVMSSTTCDFYRSQYGTPGIPSTIEEWRALPFLTKAKLVATPPSRRTFLPPQENDCIYASSGTSGGPPLFGYRACVKRPDYRYRFHDFKKATLAGILLPHINEGSLRAAGYSGRIITLDTKHIPASVRLAKLSGADSVVAHSFLMPHIAKHLKREGMAEDIRYIEMAGEPCSHALYDFLHATFPRAVIVSEYGSQEVERPIGIPCHAITGEDPLEVYHSNPDYFLELIDAEHGAPIEPSVGAEGELVVTARASDERFAFPLLRYRVGDIVRVVESPCKEHGEWSFAVLGRAEADFVKIPGGMLRADEIERVLRTFPSVSDRFEMHRLERVEDGVPKIQAVLYVEAKTGTDLKTLAETIAKNLRVGPTFTYAEGVAQGFYLPLECRMLEKKDSTEKRRRIISTNLR